MARRQSCPQWTLFSDKKHNRIKNDKPMELYIVRLSAPCRAVWLYLLQHGIPHTVIDVDFTAGHGVLEFTSELPHEEVPILIDGDVVVFQGPAILRYLASNYTNYVGFGSTLSNRMMVESLLSWANADLHRVVGYSYAYPSSLDKYRLPDESANEILIDQGMCQLAKHLERLEKNYLTSKDYLTGDSHTVADMYVATVLVTAEWTGLDLRLWPKVAEWLQREKQEPYWTQVHKAHDHLVKEVNQALAEDS